MHNPATLRNQMTSSYCERVCLCAQKFILPPMYKNNGLKVLQFTFCPHSTSTHPHMPPLPCLFLTLHISPSSIAYLFLLPSSTFPSSPFFLSLFPFPFSFHLFPTSSSLPPGLWWGCLITLCSTQQHPAANPHRDIVLVSRGWLCLD